MPGPLSATWICSPSAFWLTVTSTHGSSRSQASMALSMRLPSTVTISCGLSSGLGRQVGFLGDGQLDTALVGFGGLAEQQGDQRRFADGVGDPVDELLGQRQLLGGELDRLVGAAHLDQCDDGVQLVGRLVGLRPQRIGEALQGAQFAQGALQFGAVADRDDFGVRGTHLGTVDHQYPVVGETAPRRGRRGRCRARTLVGRRG